MYIAGIMNHFSSVPKMELIVWGSSVVGGISTAFKLRSQFKSARLTAGDIKPGSTGPRIWTNLAISAQMCGFMLPSLVYMAVIAHNKFRQPEWMTEYALPSPPDVFGVDGVTVGRAVGLLAGFAGANFSHTALKALGDQYHAIGVSAPPSPWTFAYPPVTYVFSGLQIREKPRLIDHGPFAYVRHPVFTRVSPSIFTVCRIEPLTIPMHSGGLIAEASLALAFWSYLPLYALLIAIGGCLLKVPIEVRDCRQNPYQRAHIRIRVSGKNDPRRSQTRRSIQEIQNQGPV